MNVHNEYDDDSGTLTYICTGNFDTDDMLAAIQERYETNTAVRPRAYLVDLNSADFAETDSERVRGFAKRANSLRVDNEDHTPLIMIAALDHAFGLARMRQLSEPSDQKYPVAVVRSRDEALEWMLAKGF